jgi:hypothetical protein
MISTRDRDEGARPLRAPLTRGEAGFHRSARLRVATALLLAGTAVSVLAQSGSFDSEFDEEKKPWSEIEAQLPPYPGTGNLLQFEGGAPSANRFYIDAPSLSVGADGVVRYTMMVRAAGGATNVSFEGIRCATGEHKLYALGRSDGKWVRAREPAWRRIAYRELNRPHWTLFKEFYCVHRREPEPLPLKEIVEALGRESQRLR